MRSIRNFVQANFICVRVLLFSTLFSFSTSYVRVLLIFNFDQLHADKRPIVASQSIVRDLVTAIALGSESIGGGNDCLIWLPSRDRLDDLHCDTHRCRACVSAYRYRLTCRDRQQKFTML
jgi:hypothetical protein